MHQFFCAQFYAAFCMRVSHRVYSGYGIKFVNIEFLVLVVIKKISQHCKVMLHVFYGVCMITMYIMEERPACDIKKLLL